MTSKEWEKHTLDEDRKIRKKVKKYRNRSSRRVVLGLIVAVLGFDYLNDVIKKLSKAAGAYSKSAGKDGLSLETISGGFHAVAKAMDIKLATASMILLLLALLIFLWAISVKSKADDLDTEMLRWMPGEAELADIRKRFDNDFVRGVLSRISAKETESVTVSLDGIQIENNDGDVSYNFNREGFRKLTNYESKQLAFYIGTEAFPEGFIIHQLKKRATVYDNYVRGYAEVGEIKEKTPDEAEVMKKNLRWLLKEIATITGNKKLKPKDEPVRTAVVEGGHIVINKGYSENSEKYTVL